MDTPAIATLTNGLTVAGRLTVAHATSSYGRPVFVADDGTVYNDAEILRIVPIAAQAQDGDEQPSNKYQQAYRALATYVPSAKTPHLDALAAAGLLDQLNVDQIIAIVKLMQTAYSNGQHSRGAEKIDDDAVWIDGVGGLERQEDGAWKLTQPDKDGALRSVMVDLGSRTSPAKAAAARQNAKKGGWPKGRPRKDPDNG